MTSSGSDIPAGIREYLDAAARTCQAVLGDRLLGLYLCGSAVQGDFAPHRSDIDLLGIVDGDLDRATRKELSSRLSHPVLAVPAQGLEIVLFPAEAAQTARLDLPFAFALSTGRGMKSACEPPGTANDMPIDIALCREAGIPLSGKAPNEAFGSVARPLLLAALVEELGWHLRQVEERSDGKTPVNAILNAARSLHAAETGRILSKTEGGRWWLRRHPRDAMVARALEVREGCAPASFDSDSVRGFVEMVARKINGMRRELA
jgi:predicted nucleotidyltransferase